MNQDWMLGFILQNLNDLGNVFKRIDTASSFVSDYCNLKMIDTIRIYEINALRRIRLLDKCAISRQLLQPCTRGDTVGLQDSLQTQRLKMI